MHVDIKEEPQFNEDFDVDFDQSEYLLKIFLEPCHTAVLLLWLCGDKNKGKVKDQSCMQNKKDFFNEHHVSKSCLEAAKKALTKKLVGRIGDV